MIEYARGDTEINVTTDERTTVDVIVVDDGQVAIDISYISASEHPYYSGAYEVTPSAEQQVLSTQSKVMAEDIIVKPIPSNYGLITWNGSVLTVS